MGHSFIECGGRFVHLNDVDIDLARHFLIRAVEASPLSTEIGHLRSFLGEWQDYGPGVFGTDLGQFVQQSAAHRAVLRQVLLEASKLIERFGEVVPVDYLRSAALAGRRFFSGDYPVSRVRETLGQIRELLD